MLKHAQNIRRGFDLGEPGKGEPVSALDVVAQDQAFLLRYLMSPLRLNRLTMQEALGGKYSSYDLLNMLTDAIFEGSCLSKADQYQRVGQAAYLEKLLQVTTDEAYGENAKAAANASLAKISGRISGLCNFAVGDEVADHRKRLRQMISAH